MSTDINAVKLPVRLGALVLDRQTRVIGSRFDFEVLPWFDGARDRNSETPFLRSAIQAPPFSEHNHWLGPGVHLHWSLPPALARGSGRFGPTCSVLVDDMWMPPAPNRWLVKRNGKGTRSKQWIVESDYVHPGDNRPNPAAVCYPLLKRTETRQPYVYLGRSYEVDAALKPVGKIDTSPIYLHQIDRPLTALGPNDPLFSSHYPSCRDVFGFWDPAPLRGKANYQVLGWYCDDVGDPISRAQGFFAPAQSMTSTSGTTPSAQTVQAQKDAQANVIAEVSERFDLDLKQIAPKAPDRTVCAGTLDVDAIHSPGREDRLIAGDRTANVGSEVGLGATAAEAFVALASGGHENLSRDEETERVEFVAGTQFEQAELDLQAKRAEARHNDGFRPSQGHLIWKFSAKTDPPGGTKVSPVHPELAPHLARLNAAQEAYDKAWDAIDGLRAGLYADWHRFMRSAYLQDVPDLSDIDPDDLRRLIARTRLPAIETALEETGRLQFGRGPNGLAPMVDRTRSTTNATAPYKTLRIVKVEISHGQVVDKITVHWSDGHVDVFGGTGGVPDAPIVLGPNEHFVEFKGARSDFQGKPAISQMYFITSSGTSYGPYGYATAQKDAFSIKPGPDQVIREVRCNIGSYVREIDITFGHPDAAPALQNPAPEPGSLAGLLLAQFDDLHQKLQKIDPECQLERVPGPRYWRPRDPTIAVRSPGISQAIARLEAFPANKNELIPVSVPAKGSFAATISKKRLKFPVSTSSDTDVIEFQWEAEVARLFHKNSVENAYTTDFVAKTHKTQLDRPHLEPITSPTRRSFENVTGRSLVVPSSAKHLEDRDRTFSKRSSKKGNLTSQSSAIVLPMGGFHDRLLMSLVEPQFEVADPLGFPHQTELANRVRTALEGFTPPTPQPDMAFFPIRSGEMRLGRLRLIDRFGRTQTLDHKVVRVLHSMAPSTQEPLAIRLPLAISQPTRLDFRWLSAQNDNVEVNAHPASTPICGFVMPNWLDMTVDVYGADGAHLGAVDMDGSWTPAPGRDVAPRTWQALSNPHLRERIGWLTDKKAKDRPEIFMSALGKALDQIDPAYATQKAARAFLIGRPLALVRARLNLSLAHAPHTDRSDTATRHRIEGASPSTHGFEHIKFPVRLGEHGHLNDALTGFWIDGAKEDAFWTVPGLDLQPKSGSGIEVPGTGQTSPSAFSVTVADAPTLVTMLMDPRGRVHATTGILPVKSVAIPPEMFEPQLKSLEVTFRTEPVLTPVDAFEIPLPRDANGAWSWVEHSDGDWQQIPHHPTIFKHDFLIAFGSLGPTMWTYFADEGRLMTDRSDTFARVDESKGKGLDAAAKRFGLDAKRLADVMADLIKQIDPAEMNATYRGRPLTREGWLRLQPILLTDDPLKEAKNGKAGP